jgi:hypothetical protein
MTSVGQLSTASSEHAGGDGGGWWFQRDWLRDTKATQAAGVYFVLAGLTSQATTTARMQLTRLSR